MSQEQAKQYLLQGINLAKEGQKDQARQYLMAAVKLDPSSESAWLWMSSIARDGRERVFCLQKVLEINPQNETALKGMQSLGQAKPAESQAVSSSAIPILKSDQLQSILPVVENYLRDYEPIPTPAAEVNWAQKSGGRYGEALARRRQMTRYGLMGIVLSLVALILVLGGSSLMSSLGDSALAVSTPTNTFTPTFTPTSTPGVTNTPSPEPAQAIVTATIPPNLEAGNIYGNRPTAVYPSVPVGLGQDFTEAVNRYSIGDYETAFEVFRQKREETNRGAGCVPDTYYYEILGLVEQGGRRNLQDAEALVNDALGRPGCQDTALIETAACVLNYVVGLNESDSTRRFGQAGFFCDSALKKANPPIPLTTITYARLYAAQGDTRTAAALLDNALELNPDDVNLLLVRSQIEQQRGNLQQSLNYIAQALYIEPISEPALRQRVTAYLRFAAETSDPDRQRQLYGTAVIWAQEYLLFYPGKPVGYTLLAQARLGEDKPELAEEALTRVIAAQNTLPDFEQTVVQRAYEMRAQLYLNQARYDEALADTEELLQIEPTNTAYIEQQTRLAVQLGQYSLAQDGINTLLSEADYASSNPRTDLILLGLQLFTETCNFTDEISCNYQLAANLLTDTYLRNLSPEEALLARAYRAKAVYHLTLEDSSLNDNQRTRSLQSALDDLENVLQNQDTAYNQYYRGLVLEALGNGNEALLIYQWINYWSQFYDYPFLGDVQARIEDLS